MNVFPSDRSLLAIGGLTLVAPSLKIMYTPTPKVACSTIKLMLATAEQSHRTDLIDQITNPSVSRPQTIHDPVINGLPRLVDLPKKEIENIFRSPDWVRVAALRDPVARSYSAWENRIFRRAPGETARAIELSKDVLVDGRIDLAGSFALFAKMLGEHTDAFTIDQHFLPQAHIVRTDVINYDMLIRVDKKGDMDRLSNLISERSGKTITASRLNEGMKVDLSKICDGHTANRLMATYFMDYEAFGFERRQFPATVEPYLLSASETQLVTLVRQSVERVTSVSRAAQRKMSARYGVRQVRKAFFRKISFGRMYNTPRGIHW